MSGQPDSSDDLIAELAMLMATNAKGEATSSPAPVAPKVATTPDGKPIIRIPGMDLPPLAVTPVDGPRPAGMAPLTPRPIGEARPAPTPTPPQNAEVAGPAQPKPAGEPRPVPSIRIPGMDQPIAATPMAQSTPAPQPKVDFGRAPSASPVNVAPIAARTPGATPAQPAATPAQPRSFVAKPLDLKPAGGAPGLQRVEPRVSGDARPASEPARLNLRPELPLSAITGQAPAGSPRPNATPPASRPEQQGGSAPNGGGGNNPQPQDNEIDDPIAALIAAELNATHPTNGAQPAARPVPVAVATPRPAVVTPRPVPSAPLSDSRPKPGSGPIPLRPTGLTARQVPPESDAFFVAPVFGGGGKAESQPPKPNQPPAAAAAPGPADSIDEIESLIGEAVRVEIGHERPEPAAPAAPRGPRPGAAPVLGQPRRAGIKQHDTDAAPQSAEAAILAAAAATGAEVGRVTPAVSDEPAFARKKFKPARSRGLSGGLRQYVGLAVAGTMLLAAAFGLYWVLGMSRGDPANAPVLTADASPVKQVPVAATAAAEMRSPVLDQIDGTATPPGEEQLALSDPADAEAVSVAAVNEEGGESGLANRKVRTVTVRPDGTIVASENAVAGAEPLPIARPNVPEVPGAQVEPSDLLTAAAEAASSPVSALAAQPGATAAAPLAAPDPIAAAIAGAEAPEGAEGPDATAVAALDPAAGAGTLPDGAVPTPGNVVAPLPKPRPGNREALAGQPSQSVTAEIRGSEPALNTAITTGGQAIDLLATAQPAAEEQPAARVRAAAYVQLSSQRSEGDARASARDVSNRFGSLFNGGQIEIQRADLGAKGVYYRVMLPASSRSEAAGICQQISSAGGECYVP